MISSFTQSHPIKYRNHDLIMGRKTLNHYEMTLLAVGPNFIGITAAIVT